MFERNRVDNIDHAAVPVEVTTADGDTLKGRMFIAMGRNMFEVLNGQGAFLEFEPYGGERSFISKAAIRNVKLVNVPKLPSLEGRLRDLDGFDPHGILGVPSRAPFEEVKSAWHRLSKSYHPDRYAAADLPAEVTDYLSAMARRINAAYAALESSHQRSRAVTAQRSTPVYESGAARSR